MCVFVQTFRYQGSNRLSLKCKFLESFSKQRTHFCSFIVVDCILHTKSFFKFGFSLVASCIHIATTHYCGIREDEITLSLKPLTPTILELRTQR